MNTNYQRNIGRMMKSYVDMRETVVFDENCDGPCCKFCADPLTKHAVFAHLAGVEPKFAQKEDIDEILTELAWILESARPVNYIEIANAFPLACQSMVAQFDNEHPRSGVTSFKHTRNIRMCVICLEALREAIRRFYDFNPELVIKLQDGHGI